MQPDSSFGHPSPSEDEARKLILRLNAETKDAEAVSLATALDGFLRKTGEELGEDALQDLLYDVLTLTTLSPDLSEVTREQVNNLLTKHVPEQDGDGNIMGPNEDGVFLRRGISWN